MNLGMSAMLNLDQQTMFTINALLLVVFSIAFAFAGLGQKDRTYWLFMVLANLVLAIAFIIFSNELSGTIAQILFPNLLLFIGLSLRLIAIRAFFQQQVSLVFVFIPLTAAIITFMLWPLLGNSFVFGFINFLIMAQLIVIIWALIIEREELKSKWGLIISYAVLVLSSFLRVLQGWFLESSMGSLLPVDIFLQLHLVAAAIHISANGSFSLLIAYERSVSKLREIALRDPLTGLLNRWSFETVISSIKNKKSPKLMNVIMIDIDYFKFINDTYGHSAGDAALKHFAKCLQETFIDYNLIARVGGEEFMILIPDQGCHFSKNLCNDFQANLAAKPLSYKDTTIKFTASIGISTGYIKSRSEFNKIWENADKALYQAKLHGRDTITVYE